MGVLASFVFLFKAQPEHADLMDILFSRHEELGKLKANLNWIKCGDPNGVSNEFRNVTYNIGALKGHMNLLHVNLDLILPDDEVSVFKDQCAEKELEAMILHEIRIEKEYRPHDMVFNDKAVINKSRIIVPEDITIGLSFGWKFLFPFITTNDNIHEILAQMEMCIDETIPPISHWEAYSEIARILNARNKSTSDFTIQWLCFVALRTKAFFKANPDIFATRSDKGAHTVILDLSQYENSIRSMLDNPSYLPVEFNPLEDLVGKEKAIMHFFTHNFKTKALVEGTYEPAIKQLAKFYGLVKVHKENFCLRPITAMSLAPGHSSGRVFDKLLKSIFPRTHFHIRDSYDMKEFSKTALINEDDILVSFDVVSMYTSIPRSLVKDIIMSKLDVFHQLFGVGKIILERIVDFLLTDSTFFTALGFTYRQMEGLPMGGCVSTTLARMVMDRVANFLLIREPHISFLRIFVDDTIAALKRDTVSRTLFVLNDFHPNIRFTHEIENDNKSINFLNLTLIRDGNFIITNWYRKAFASGRLLPYYSSHKRSTIMATAEAFIETVIKLSDESFFQVNKPIVIKTLNDNGFPETIVLGLMNKFYTLMSQKPDKPPQNARIYKIFPHAICESRKIKTVLHRLKYDNIVYAESTKNTKINFVSTRKTITPVEKKGNVILSSTCVCNSKCKFDKTNFNETGEKVSERILTTFDKCTHQKHAFREVKYHRGLAYKKQTGYLLKYVEWKNLKTTDRKGMPNQKFVKLLNRKK